MNGMNKMKSDDDALNTMMMELGNNAAPAPEGNEGGCTCPKCGYEGPEEEFHGAKGGAMTPPMAPPQE